MSARPNEQGFTLVEILIALSILGLVMIVLTSTFDFAQRSFATMSSAEHQFVDVTVTRRLLVDALGQVDSEATTATALFSGTSSGFAVMALGPRILSASNPLLLQVEASPDGGLVLSWQNQSPDNSQAAVVRRIIASGFQVRFAYFGSRVGWITEWNDKTVEPSLLRLAFSQRGNLAAELAIIVPIHRLTPMLCAIRATASGCANG